MVVSGDKSAALGKRGQMQQCCVGLVPIISVSGRAVTYSKKGGEWKNEPAQH